VELTVKQWGKFFLIIFLIDFERAVRKKEGIYRIDIMNTRTKEQSLWIHTTLVQKFQKRTSSISKSFSKYVFMQQSFHTSFARTVSPANRKIQFSFCLPCYHKISFFARYSFRQAYCGLCHSTRMSSQGVLQNHIQTQPAVLPLQRSKRFVPDNSEMIRIDDKIGKSCS